MASRAGARPWAAELRAALARSAVAAPLLDDLERAGESRRLPAPTRRAVAFVRRVALQPALVTAAERAKLEAELGPAALAELLLLGGALAAVVAIERALGGARSTA